MKNELSNRTKKLSQLNVSKEPKKNAHKIPGSVWKCWKEWETKKKLLSEPTSLVRWAEYGWVSFVPLFFVLRFLFHSIFCSLHAVAIVICTVTSFKINLLSAITSAWLDHSQPTNKHTERDKWTWIFEKKKKIISKH